MVELPTCFSCIQFSPLWSVFKKKEKSVKSRYYMATLVMGLEVSLDFYLVFFLEGA